MTREEIIRNLEYTMEKHKNDTVHTFETNISAMCKDILDYLKQEPCEDAVSRQVVKSALCELCGNKRSCPFRNEDCDDLNAIDALPTVTPKEKIGEWIKHQATCHPHGIDVNFEYEYYECTKCHTKKDYTTNFCPDCGAKMVEPQESEDKE